MGVVDDLINAGYGGYRGWGENEAAADYNATGGSGKITGGGGGGDGGSRGNIAPFSFNYEEAAKQAFGELAPYYDRLLTESKGNMNLVLARLTEDYDMGLRFKTEDTNFAKESVDLASKEAARLDEISRQRITDNALARGLYQKSAFDTTSDPNRGFGIPDTLQDRRMLSFAYQQNLRDRNRSRLDTGMNRFQQTSTIRKDRSTFDTKKKQDLYEFELADRRKKEAAELANVRGERAYRDWASKATLV